MSAPLYSEILRLPEDLFEDYFVVMMFHWEGSPGVGFSIDSIYKNGSINAIRCLPPCGTIAAQVMVFHLITIVISNQYIPEQFVINITNYKAHYMFCYSNSV